jgi:virulence factor Mce-like protein
MRLPGRKVGGRRELPTWFKGLLGLCVSAAAFAAIWVGVTFSYGGYDDHYQLVGDFPRAGQGLTNGSDVTYRGVDIGEVSSVELVDRQARITLDMNPDFRVPEDATFVVRPKTIFGEKYVDVTFPSGETGPYLGDGDVVADAQAATEVEDFFEGSDDLFDQLDEQELAELFTTLNETARGTGQDVAASFESGAEATALGADTIAPQIRALSSWAEFQDAISGIGGDLNTIADNSNVSLEEFNAHREEYERALAEFRPFAENLAALLAGTRPDIDTYLERGDSVVRMLTANEEHLTELVEGLGQYVQAFGGGLSEERLPNGEGFAYFKNFLYVGDVEAFLCTHLADAPPEFQGLRDAILALQTEIDCTGYYEASPAPGPGGPGAPVPQPSRDQLDRAAQRLVDQLYGLLGQPQGPIDQDLDTLLSGLLTPAEAPA